MIKLLTFNQSNPPPDWLIHFISTSPLMIHNNITVSCRWNIVALVLVYVAIPPLCQLYYQKKFSGHDHFVFVHYFSAIEELQRSALVFYVCIFKKSCLFFHFQAKDKKVSKKWGDRGMKNYKNTILSTKPLCREQT